MKRSTTTLLAAFLCLAGGTCAAWADDLPQYKEKPNTWRSNIVAIEGPMVRDADLAAWLKAAETRVADAGATLTVLAAYNQCFGGGFLTEMERAKLTRFGAVSASRYYQPAYYRPLNEFKEDPKGGGSFFTRAWIGALESGRTNKWNDREVANEAHLKKFMPAEATQYTSSEKDRAGIEGFGGAVRPLIILFVGDPDPSNRDGKSVTELMDQLAKVYLMKPKPAVLILYGDGTPPPDLRKAFSWPDADKKAHAARPPTSSTPWPTRTAGWPARSPT